jgi:hypothetical protein
MTRRKSMSPRARERTRRTRIKAMGVRSAMITGERGMRRTERKVEAWLGTNHMMFGTRGRGWRRCGCREDEAALNVGLSHRMSQS